MTKQCIFDKNKVCNDCGECYKCELDARKNCNNCGKCMEKEGFDLKAIKIEEVLEMPEEIKEYEDDDMNIIDELLEDNTYESSDEFTKNEELEDSMEFEFIEDHEEIKEILDDEDKFNKMANEVFPGLIKIGKRK